MIDNSELRGFTTEYNGIQTSLLIDVSLIDPFTNKESSKCKGLIDTGANCCMVSHRMTKKLSLISIGRGIVATAGGEKEVNKYSLQLKLPDNYISETIFVTEGPLDNQGFDVLIGMDILSKGDFTITKNNGNTLVSFITPSQEPIDLVKKYAVKKLYAEKFKEEKKSKKKIKEKNQRKNGHNNRKKKRKK